MDDEVVGVDDGLQMLIIPDKYSSQITNYQMGASCHRFDNRLIIITLYYFNETKSHITICIKHSLAMDDEVVGVDDGLQMLIPDKYSSQLTTAEITNYPDWVIPSQVKFKKDTQFLPYNYLGEVPCFVNAWDVLSNVPISKLSESKNELLSSSINKSIDRKETSNADNSSDSKFFEDSLPKADHIPYVEDPVRLTRKQKRAQWLLAQPKDDDGSDNDMLDQKTVTNDKGLSMGSDKARYRSCSDDGDSVSIQRPAKGERYSSK